MAATIEFNATIGLRSKPLKTLRAGRNPGPFFICGISSFEKLQARNKRNKEKFTPGNYEED